jgi:glucosamine-phosphate N-acetyltransferase
MNIDNNGLLENGIKNLKLNHYETLFDSQIFKNIDLKNDLVNKYDDVKLFKNDDGMYFFDLGDNLVLRSLKIDDFERDYLKLLEQLTVVGDDVNKEKFEDRFGKMKSCLNSYYILVVHDLKTNKIVGSTTLVNEQKFIRHASSRGRIEDVVVDDKYRGKKLGKLLLDFAVVLSKVIGCYKVSLECKDDLKKFYQQFGFQLEDGQNYLCKRK